MLTKKRLTILLVLIWLGLFVASFVLSTQIDGPRNMDTGFKRLDILARYQFIALGVAVFSAVAGVLGRKEGKRVMLIGFAPILITVLLVVAIVVATFIGNRPAPSNPVAPPQPTAPAVDVPTPTK